MKARGLLLVTVALALAGCSSREDAAPSPDAEATGAVAATDAATDSAAGESEAVAPNEIPQGIRGTWGINAADCDASRSDAKGAMTIDANSIKFYESIAKLKKVDAVEANRIRAQFGFSGEGQNWDQGMDFTLSADGKTLVRRDSGPDAIPDPLTYQACGAQSGEGA